MTSRSYFLDCSMFGYPRKLKSMENTHSSQRKKTHFDRNIFEIFTQKTFSRSLSHSILSISLPVSLSHTWLSHLPLSCSALSWTLLHHCNRLILHWSRPSPCIYLSSFFFFSLLASNQGFFGYVFVGFSTFNFSFFQFVLGFCILNFLLLPSQRQKPEIWFSNF